MPSTWSTSTKPQDGQFLARSGLSSRSPQPSGANSKQSSERLSCIRTQVHQVQPNIDEMEYGVVPFRSISHSSGSPPSGHSHLYRIASDCVCPRERMRPNQGDVQSLTRKDAETNVAIPTVMPRTRMQWTMDREPDRSDKLNKQKDDLSSLQEMQVVANIASVSPQFKLKFIKLLSYDFKNLREIAQRLIGSKDHPNQNLLPRPCISDLIRASLPSVDRDRARENPSSQAGPDIGSTEPTRDILPEQNQKIAVFRLARENREPDAVPLEAQQSSVPQVVRQLLAPDSGLFEGLEKGATPEGKLLQEIEKLASIRPVPPGVATLPTQRIEVTFDGSRTSNSERAKKTSYDFITATNGTSGPTGTAKSIRAIEPPPLPLPERSLIDRLSRQMLEEAVPEIRKLRELSTAGGLDATHKEPHYPPNGSLALSYNNTLLNNQTTHLADEMPTLSEWSEFSAKLLKLRMHASAEVTNPPSLTDAGTFRRLDYQIRGIIERQRRLLEGSEKAVPTRLLAAPLPMPRGRM